MEDDNDANYCKSCGEECNWNASHCEECVEDGCDQAPSTVGSYTRNAHVSVGGEEQ